MIRIEEIIKLKIKPKEKQTLLVESIISKEIPVEDFFNFFESASYIDKGTCADVMKHVSSKNPSLLSPYLDILLNYINYPAPRVKWGIPEAIGNMSKEYPGETAKAISLLLKNITEDKINTTVIRWCSAYALTEIAKYNVNARKELLPLFERFIADETNNGVRNLYVKALKEIENKKLV